MAGGTPEAVWKGPIADKLGGSLSGRCRPTIVLNQSDYQRDHVCDHLNFIEPTTIISTELPMREICGIQMKHGPFDEQKTPKYINVIY